MDSDRTGSNQLTSGTPKHCLHAPQRFAVSAYANPTAFLSDLSDWVCGPLAAHSARRFSSAIQTPTHFVEMLFLIEDKRFAIHFGLDPIAIARALIFNVSGHRLQGASTIAQQIYNTRWTNPPKGTRSRTLKYKIRQGLWTIWQSATTPKISILAEYLNTVYWGRSYHGLDCATEKYFGASRSSISCTQSFFLAERLAAPNRISPARIYNLVRRPAIASMLMQHRVTINDVVSLYEQIYGCGGELWRTLVK